jgi:ribosomal protein S27AE
MTKVVRKKVKCVKCGFESEQTQVYSVNHALGKKEDNDKLINHKQVCPNCGYEAVLIGK